MNRRLSHCLYAVENGAEDTPAVTVQSNLDGLMITAVLMDVADGAAPCRAFLNEDFMVAPSLSSDFSAYKDSFEIDNASLKTIIPTA